MRLSKFGIMMLVISPSMQAHASPPGYIQSSQSDPVELPRRERRRDVQVLYDAIASRDAIQLLMGRFDEIVAAGSNSAKLESDLQSLVDVHMVMMNEYRDVLARAESGELTVQEVNTVAREVQKFQEGSDDQLAKLLKKHLRPEAYDSVVNSLIRIASQGFYHCVFLAKELNISEKQVQQMDDIRKVELKLLESADTTSVDPLRKVRKPISRNLAKIADVLNEQQLTRVWRATGVLSENEDVDDFLKSKHGKRDIENFVMGSRFLTNRWNELFPNERIPESGS